jgi:ABC-type antimicrobial peptide transport system permease subunit
MNSLDLISMSFRNLMRRKTRAFLTVLGVVIGTASIVVMLSLGLAMEKSFKEQLAQMGSLNVIQVYTSYGGYGDTQQTAQPARLDEDAVTAFKAIPGVQAVMAQKNSYMKIVSGRMVGGVSIIGIDPEVMEAFDFEAEEGRLLLSSDKNAIVFGKMVAFNFYNPRSRGDQHMRGMYFRAGPDQPEPKPPVDLMSGKQIFALTEENEALEIALNTSLQFFTVAKYNKVFNMGWNLSECQSIGKRLSAYCRSHAIEIRLCETNDERFGTVNSYPITAWEDFLEVAPCVI